MIGVSPRYTAIAQRIFKNWYSDSCEILLQVDTTDAYGTTKQTFPSQSPPVICRGHLREIERIPTIDELGSTPVTVGNFIIHLDADATIPNSQKFAIRVNGGDIYIVENVYKDKANKFSTQCYCYRVK